MTLRIWGKRIAQGPGHPGDLAQCEPRKTWASQKVTRHKGGTGTRGFLQRRGNNTGVFKETLGLNLAVFLNSCDVSFPAAASSLANEKHFELSRGPLGRLFVSRGN